MAKYILAILLYILFGFSIPPAHATSPGDVVINEVAWMGTTNSHNDEWVELYNNTDTEISIDGWILRATGDKPKRPNIMIEGAVAPRSFFLLERTDDTSVPNIPADQIYTGLLGNDGEHLELIDLQENVVDRVNSFGDWFAGDNTDKYTMERKNPTLAGSDAVSWANSQSSDGTPKAQNSVYQSEEASPPPPPTEPTQPPAQNPPPESDPPPGPQPEADQPLAETPDPEPKTEPTATSTLESATSSVLDADSDESASSPQTNPEQPLQQIVYPSNIFINELMPSPLGSDAEEEWIEIVNESDEAADISSWQIRDTMGAINTYTFPEGSSIAAHAFLVHSRPTTRITMNNTEDAIELLRPDGEVAQTILYSKAPKGQSYARTKTSWAWSNVPTPGSANIIPAPPAERGESQPQIETKKASVYKTKSTNPKNTSINPGGNSKDLKKESATTTQAPTTTDTDSTQTAAIGEVKPQAGNTFVYVIAPLVALLSAVFIFLLKKRLQQ